MRTFNLEDQPLNAARSSSCELPGIPPRDAKYGNSAAASPWRPSRRAIVSTASGLVLVAVLVFALVFALPGSSRSATSTADAEVLLVKNVPVSCVPIASGDFWEWLSPTHYHLQFDLEHDHFVHNASVPGGAALFVTASAALELSILRPTSCVVLHASGLAFTGIEVVPAGAAAPTVLCSTHAACVDVVHVANRGAVASSAFTDLVTVDLGAVTLDPGAGAVLLFNYTAAVGATPKITGMHRSAAFAACTPGKGCEARTLVATQLERTGARKLFPGYDMPASKAVFHVSVSVPDADAPVVLSNAPQASRTVSPDGATATVVFGPSPLMSTYLVALVAGQLEEAPAVSAEAAAAPIAGRRLAQSNGTAYDVHAWAVPGRAALMAQALAYAQGALPYYEQIFDYSQPAELQQRFDLVAVPGKDGAMENWGLLLLDEARALHNASAAGTYNTLQTASVVCHEVAHQWAGNLATCVDWTQLFMNEGLASALEYGCMQHVAPWLSAEALQYKVWAPAGEHPSAHDGPLSTALRLSGDPLTPPLVPATEWALDEDRAYSQTYSKGASLFLMLRPFLNFVMAPLRDPAAAPFFEGVLRTLMARTAYSTYSDFDFYSALYDLANNASVAMVGPGKPMALFPFANTLQMRIAPFVEAATPAARRVVGSNGTAPSGSWFYTRTFPHIHAELPNLVVPGNYPLTLANLGGNQTRFCAWNMTQEEADVAGLADIMPAILDACYTHIRFITTLQLSNLSDCAAGKAGGNISTTAGLAADGAPLLSEGNLTPGRWVANQGGARVWRTSYGQTQFDNLVGELASLTACADDAVSHNEMCCATLEDMVEAAALVSDSSAFAWTGADTAVNAVKAAAAAAAAPAARTSGAGRYLLLLPAIETLLQDIRPLVAENATCLASLDALVTELLPTDLMLQVMVGAATAAGNASVGGGSQALQNAALARLAASPLLLRAALRPDAAASANGTSAGGDAELQRVLCARLHSSPLWADYVNSAAANSTPADTTSPDLLPAIYGVAAAMPPACEAAISAAYNASALAASGLDAGAGMRMALTHCWLNGPVPEEAVRCAWGLIWASGYSRVVSLLPVFDRVQPEAGASLAQALLFAQRLAQGTRRRPWTLGQAAQRSVGGVEELLTMLQQDVAAEHMGQDDVCTTLDLAPSAVTPTARDALAALLAGHAAGCTLQVRARAHGKMLQAQKAAQAARGSLCGYLDARAAGQP